MKNENKPITPIYGATNVLMTDNSQDESWLKASGALTGLTKLEYASIQIAASISNYVKLDIDENAGARFIGVDMVAQMSVAIAKALLTELQNTEK